MNNLGKQLLFIVLVAYPVLLHAFIINQQIELWQLLLAFSPLLITAIWLSFRWTSRVWWPLISLTFALLIYFVLHSRHGLVGLLAVNGLFHAALNLSMLWLFGSTLIQGRVPLITQIARRISADIPAEIVTYTRHVTIAWCLLFMLQVSVSLLLYIFAPLAAWSFFINVLDFPLLALMFIAEFTYRTLRFPEQPVVSIMKIIDVYRRDYSTPVKVANKQPPI
jgi:uncharacterized membrane protein